MSVWSVHLKSPERLIVMTDQMFASVLWIVSLS